MIRPLLIATCVLLSPWQQAGAQEIEQDRAAIEAALVQLDAADQDQSWYFTMAISQDGEILEGQNPAC